MYGFLVLSTLVVGGSLGAPGLVSARVAMDDDTMFDRYSQEALLVIFSARGEATRLGASAIDTEHLLLGVCRVGKGVAWAVLEDLSMKRGDLIQEIDASAKWRVATQESDDLPLSTSAKQVLRYAEEEADSSGASTVAPEHILVGLFRAEDGYGFMAMRRRDIDLDDLRNAIRARRMPER
jgi:ATP-dependent Clp protease ATP-binding subunit ClpC